MAPNWIVHNSKREKYYNEGRYLPALTRTEKNYVVNCSKWEAQPPPTHTHSWFLMFNLEAIVFSSADNKSNSSLLHQRIIHPKYLIFQLPGRCIQYKIWSQERGQRGVILACMFKLRTLHKIFVFPLPSCFCHLGFHPAPSEGGLSTAQIVIVYCWIKFQGWQPEEPVEQQSK